MLNALGRRAARAVGRLRRPGREQQHHDRGPASFVPEARDRGCGGRPLRPHPALRHPRARDGLDPERDRAARADPALRRHLPGLLRLHARRRAAGRADAAAGRPTSGRTTPSGSARTARPTSRSSTWPRCARSPGCDRPPGDANETAVRVAGRSSSAPTARRPRADPPEHPGARRARHAPAGGRQAAATSSPTRPAGPPQVILIATGSEVQLAVEARERARGRGHRHPGGVDAVRRVVRGAGQRLPRVACCRPSVQARVSVEAGIAHAVAPVRRRRWARSSPSSTSARRADDQTLFREFGFTAENVVAAAGSCTPRRSGPHERTGDAIATMTNERLTATLAATPGVSIWLDDLSARAAAERQPADLDHRRQRRRRHHQPDDLRRGAGPRRRLRPTQVARAGRPRRRSVDEAVRVITPPTSAGAATSCARLSTPPAASTAGSRIEVDPRLAHDTDATFAEAVDLWKAVDRPNLLIKIPATRGGPARDHRGLAEGISVNVTLIFSVERYRAVMDAYLDGLEQAAANGHDLAGIALGGVASSSPASTPRSTSGWRRSAPTRRSRCAARRASPTPGWPTQAYQEMFAGDRWDALAAEGAKRAASAVGVHRREEPGVPGHALRRPSWSRPTPSTRCRRRRSRRRRPRRASTATRSPAPCARPRGLRRPRGAGRRPRPTSFACWRTRASTSSRSPGPSC